jgi:hypothetical protein
MKILVENLKGKGHMKDQYVGENILLKWILSYRVLGRVS